MEDWKATMILQSTREAFMQVLVNDIGKDGIGPLNTKDGLKSLYDFIFGTAAIFYDIQEEKAKELNIGEAVAAGRIRHTNEESLT